jgi:3-dehydroquinate dehydratase
MGWALTILIVGIVLIVIGGVNAFNSTRRRSYRNIVLLSPNAGMFVTGLGAAMFVVAITLASKLR